MYLIFISHNQHLKKIMKNLVPNQNIFKHTRRIKIIYKWFRVIIIFNVVYSQYLKKSCIEKEIKMHKTAVFS